MKSFPACALQSSFGLIACACITETILFLLLGMKKCCGAKKSDWFHLSVVGHFLGSKFIVSSSLIYKKKIRILLNARGLLIKWHLKLFFMCTIWHPCNVFNCQIGFFKAMGFLMGCVVYGVLVTTRIFWYFWFCVFACIAAAGLLMFWIATQMFRRYLKVAYPDDVMVNE